MKVVSSLNFLIGFLAFFVYLIIVITFTVKLDKASIYDRKKFNRNRVFQQMIWSFPFLFGFLYFISRQQTGLALSFITFPTFYFLGEYFFFQPKLDSLISDANRIFTSLRYGGEDERYCFDSKKDRLILNRDMPKYFKGWLVDLDLDRVYKNNLNEYFWVQGSAKGESEPTIKHLDPHAARNLLRVDRSVYLQEFNEEPYYKSK